MHSTSRGMLVGHRLVAGTYKSSHYDHHLECCAVVSLSVQLGNISGAGKCRSTTETNNNVLPIKGTIWGAEHTKMSRKEGKRSKMTKFVLSRKICFVGLLANRNLKF